MGCTRRGFLALASAGMVAGLAGCTPAPRPSEPEQPAEPEEPEVDLGEFSSLALDTSAWRYDEDNDVYFQLGLTYCKTPATTTYESLAVFVPGPYFTAEKNGDTYSCTVNEKAVVGNFTPATAPVLMPINTGGLAAQASPTAYGYDGLAPYLDAGCVYVYAGFRGRSAGYDTTTGSNELFAGGSPWPVVDLKAAVRYLRYNAACLPCDASRVFVFGFAAGGGAGAVLGASGDATLFDPYLEQIGAITHDADGNPVSDAIAGSASWCPITSFDTVDAAYEWAQGQYASDGTRAEGTWTRQLSQGLAGSYAAWLNEAGLCDADGAPLTLDETEAGVYTMGSYVTELLGTIDEAATSFVQHTSFPYTYTPHHLDDPSFPGDPNLAATRALDSSTLPSQTTSSAETPDTTSGMAGVALVQSTVYDSPQNYFAALNAESWWINYNHSSASVSVSSLRDFSLRLRPATLSSSAYDRPDRSSACNQLFGIGEESTLHFSSMVGELVEGGSAGCAELDGWDEEYAGAWSEDLEKLDALETDMRTRVDMMNPLFWLSSGYEGAGQSSVAPHWRVNEGLFDSDVPLVTATNIVCALRACEGVADVAHTAVWGQGHVLAERSGTATDNLLNWVVSCCSA